MAELTGNVQNQLGIDEHDPSIKAKKVTLVGYDTATNTPFRIGSTGLITEKWDYLKQTYPNDTTDVFTFKSGGSGGTTVAVVTIVYTDSTKENIDSVAKT